jgi:AcrR family transcriptional regulator
MVASRTPVARRAKAGEDRRAQAVPPAAGNGSPAEVASVGAVSTDVHKRQGGHVAEMQRRRLLTATTELAFNGGVHALSVAVLCERAGLSRRTFYDLFDDRETCIAAAFKEALDVATEIAIQAGAGKERWRERVRAGLTALLALFDRDPGMGRLLVVEALACGPTTLQTRRSALAQAAVVIDQGRYETTSGRSRPSSARSGGAQASEPPPLTAEGIVGAVLSLIHGHMLERDSDPLTNLTGSLMALIVYPYLGATASKQELETALPSEAPLPRRVPSDPFKDLPIRLTYRTACVLTSIAQSPGASSKHIARESGITDAGQISRLLKRLDQSGLIQDKGIGPTKGMARAWTLTNRGHDILQATGQT